MVVVFRFATLLRTFGKRSTYSVDTSCCIRRTLPRLGMSIHLGAAYIPEATSH